MRFAAVLLALYAASVQAQTSPVSRLQAAPPNAPAVPPGEFLTAKAVSGAVIFAAVAREPEKAPERFRSFVAQGLDVTNRVKLWEAKG